MGGFKYSENLLMCAIRNRQEIMSEHLINRGVNVDYEADFFVSLKLSLIQKSKLIKHLLVSKIYIQEFKDKQQLSVNYLKYSCRQMAYDTEMWKIVDFIDIFSVHTDKRIVKYLSRRYVNEIECLNRRNSEISSSKVRNYLNQYCNNRVGMSNDGGGEDAEVAVSEKSGEKKSNTSSELIREIESAKAESIGEINLIEPNPNVTIKHEFVTPEIVEEAIKVSWN